MTKLISSSTPAPASSPVLEALFARIAEKAAQDNVRQSHEPGLDWAFATYDDGKQDHFTKSNQIKPMAGRVRGVVIEAGTFDDGSHFIYVMRNHSFLVDNENYATLYFCEETDLSAFVGCLVEIAFHHGTQSDGVTPQGIFYIDKITDRNTGKSVQLFDTQADAESIGGLFTGAPVETPHPKPVSDKTNQERAQVTAGPLFEQRQMDLADYTQGAAHKAQR